MIHSSGSKREIRSLEAGISDGDDITISFIFGRHPVGSFINLEIFRYAIFLALLKIYLQYLLKYLIDQILN